MAEFRDCVPQPATLEGLKREPVFARYAEPWVYCNYPEQLPADGSALGDRDQGNRYLNVVNVSGTVQVFASYLSQMPFDTTFGLLLQNPGPTAVTAVLMNNAHRHSGQFPDWCDVSGGVWQDFFTTNPKRPLTILPGKEAWLFRKPVPRQKFFNSLVRFETNGPLRCFAYIFRVLNKVDGTANLYPWAGTSRQYRGEGDGFFLMALTDLRLSDLPVYWTSHRCGAASPGEMIPIEDPGSRLRHACETGANLGNWAAQYLYRITVTNDLPDVRTVAFYLGSPTPDTNANPVLVFEGEVKYGCVGGHTWWNFLTDTLAPGQTVTYEFQHVEAANATHPAVIQLKSQSG